MCILGGLQRRLAEEYERCAHYLDPATRKPLVAAVEAQLLERHMGAILERGFDALMAEQRVPDLARCDCSSHPLCVQGTSGTHPLHAPRSVHPQTLGVIDIIRRHYGPCQLSLNTEVMAALCATSGFAGTDPQQQSRAFP